MFMPSASSPFWMGVVDFWSMSNSFVYSWRDCPSYFSNATLSPIITTWLLFKLWESFEDVSHSLTCSNCAAGFQIWITFFLPFFFIRCLASFAIVQHTILKVQFLSKKYIFLHFWHKMCRGSNKIACENALTFVF